MSSHHIVRDQQEPALLLTNVEGLQLRHIETLLEWNPTVLVLSSCYEKVASWGVKIDVIIDSREQSQSNTYDYSPFIKRVEVADVLEGVLNYLTNLNYEALTIYGSYERWSKEIEQIKPNIRLVIHSVEGRYFYRDYFKKWVGKNHRFNVRSSVMLYNVRNLEPYQSGYRSIEEGFIEMRANQPFWIQLYHEEI